MSITVRDANSKVINQCEVVRDANIMVEFTSLIGFTRIS